MSEAQCEARLRICKGMPVQRTRGKREHVERVVITWATDALLYNHEDEFTGPTFFTDFDKACWYLDYLTDGCNGRFTVKLPR